MMKHLFRLISNDRQQSVNRGSCDQAARNDRTQNKNSLDNTMPTGCALRIRSKNGNNGGTGVHHR